MPRLAPTAYALVLALVLCPGLLTACGGGGGSDGPATAPGTLRSVALEGAGAPGTAGAFAALPTYPLMDAADGGFCAFVAPTTDVLRPEVLYAVQADAAATLVPVFQIDEPLPAPSDGAIDTFEGVWVTENGHVLALVTITGDSSLRTFGLISARVVGGAATEKAAVVYSGQDLTGIGGSGALAAVDADTLLVASNGTVWFLGQDGPAGPLHLLSAERSGANLTMRARVGAVLGAARGAGSVASVDAFTIDEDGTLYAYVVTATGGASERLIARTSVGNALDTEFFGTGDFLPTAGTVTNAWKGGRLIAYASGQVVWVAQGSLAGTDDVLMLFDPLAALPADRWIDIVRSGQTAPSTGMGAIGAIDLLNVATSCGYPAIRATVVGSTNGVSTGTFGVLAAGGNNLTLDSSNLAVVGGSLVPAGWTDLLRTTPPDDEVSAGGSSVLAQTFGGTSVLYWVVRGTGTFRLASEGEATPDGDTFGSFATNAAHTVARENVLFRANLVTAGSGLFRRGP